MRLDRHRLHNRKLVDTRLESLCFVFSLSPPLRTLRCLASWALRPAASRAMQARGTTRTVSLRGKGCGRRRSVSKGGVCLMVCRTKREGPFKNLNLRPPRPRTKKTKKLKTNLKTNSLRPLLQDRRLARRGVPDLLGRSSGGAHKGSHRTVSLVRQPILFFLSLFFFGASFFFFSPESVFAAFFFFFSPSPPLPHSSFARTSFSFLLSFSSLSSPLKTTTDTRATPTAAP